MFANSFKRFPRALMLLTARGFFTGAVLVTVPTLSYGYASMHEPIRSDTKPAFALENIVSKVKYDELSKHNKLDDLWVAIHGQVYDLTEFASMHPGGISILLQYAGKDATDLFKKIHSTDVIEKLLPPRHYLGILDGEVPESFKQVSDEELLMQERYKNRPELSHIYNVSDFEYVTKKLISTGLFNYFATGSDDEITLRNNHYAFQRVFFKPRVLTDTKHVDLGTKMLDAKVGLPFYVTAFAGQGKADDDAELNLTRVAARNDIIQMIPIMAAKTAKEITGSAKPGQTQWCQLHFETEYDKENAKNTIETLCSFDTVKAIFINADIAAESNREKDFKTRAYSQSREFDSFSNPENIYPTLTWEDFLKFREWSSKPVVIKGVQRPEDIIKAAELGFRGIVISNHGGRQLDYSKPPLETLAETMPKLRECSFYDKDKFDIYIDGGIRRGSDIIKALSLGATGVGLGRPFAYSLASYGEEGCERLVGLLKEELERDMKLLGCNDVKKLNEDYVDISGLYHRFNSDDRLYNAVYEPMAYPKFKDEI